MKILSGPFDRQAAELGSSIITTYTSLSLRLYCFRKRHHTRWYRKVTGAAASWSCVHLTPREEHQ